jgi:hypothetical protein
MRSMARAATVFDSRAAVRLGYGMSAGGELEWPDGEEQAWERLSRLDPTEVCRRAVARFDDRSSAYGLEVFNSSISVYPEHREIGGSGELCDMLLGRLSGYSRLSILAYLAQAQDTAASGVMKNPRDLAGGLIFSVGSHALPLDQLAARYGRDAAAFLRRGVSLGGERCDYGDASIKLHPFPRVPVVLVLRTETDEFPANVLLLLDSTCKRHLPMDVVWSTAMIAVQVML